MNTDDQHDFLSPRRGPAPLTPSELAEQLATDYPQLRIHPAAPLVGGMGAVYSATLTTSAGPRHVAIKVLHWHLMDDPAFTARFQREQALLRQLDQPNIVKLRDIGHTADGLPFLVMDWIAGDSLAEFTQPSRDPKFNLTRQQLLKIADDLCAAAHHAHEKGILHRDLKPQNIIVTPEGRAIVLDFGIARSLRPGHTLTQPGDAPGTHGYIAPEVLAGEKPDARADIYSLGIIIYQLLMKKLPDVFAARPSEHSLDPRFDEIVMKAAAAEREKRYASAEALRAALGSTIASAMTSSHIQGADNPAMLTSLPTFEQLRKSLTEENQKEFDYQTQFAVAIANPLLRSYALIETGKHLGLEPYVNSNALFQALSSVRCIVRCKYETWWEMTAQEKRNAFWAWLGSGFKDTNSVWKRIERVERRGSRKVAKWLSGDLATLTTSQSSEASNLVIDAIGEWMVRSWQGHVSQDFEYYPDSPKCFEDRCMFMMEYVDNSMARSALVGALNKYIQMYEADPWRYTSGDYASAQQKSSCDLPHGSEDRLLAVGSSAGPSNLDPNFALQPTKEPAYHQHEKLEATNPPSLSQFAAGMKTSLTISSEPILCKSKCGLTKVLCDLTVRLIPDFILIVKQDRLDPFPQPEETWIPLSEITSPKVKKHSIWPFPDHFRIELPRIFSVAGTSEALKLYNLERWEAEAIRDHVLAKYKQTGAGGQAS